MKPAPVTVYPDPDLKRAIQEIAEDDHDRPVCHVIEMAMKAYAVLYREDKYKAIQLADSFKSDPPPRRVA
jgi:hypothetical protein